MSPLEKAQMQKVPLMPSNIRDKLQSGRTAWK